jgi:hypothetical protein
MQASISNAQRQMLVAVTLFVTVNVAASTLGAQTRAVRDEPIAPFSSFYFATGTFLMDVSKLNPRFERLDLDQKDRPGFFTISNDGYSVGFGGYGAVIQRLVAGAEWHMADLGQEASPSGKTNQLKTSYWMGTLGYAVFTTWRVNIVPLLGIGTGNATLILKSRNGGPTVPEGQDPTFDEVIMSPGTESTMKGNYVMVQPGVGVDALLLRQETDRIGITLGIRLTSMISPNRTTWKYNGREVFGGPDVGPSGGVVRVMVGLGGFRLSGASGSR